MSRFSDQLANLVSGVNVPIAGASVYVYRQDESLATLTDAGGASLANPLRTDSFGNYEFYADDGVYDLRFVYGGKLVYERDGVLVGPDGPDPTSLIAEVRAAAVQTAGDVVSSAASAGTATSANTLAQAAATTAAAASAAAPGVYASTAAGLAGTANGASFWVQGSGTDAVILYRHNGAAADEIARLPASLAVRYLSLLLGLPMTDVTTETIGLITYTNADAGAGDVFCAPEVPRAGLLNSVSFSLSGSTAGEIWIATPISGTTYDLTHVLPFSSLAAGDHTITFSSPMDVPAGSLVAVRGYAISVRYHSTAPAGTYYFANGFGPGAGVEGTDISRLPSPSRGAVAYSLSSAPDALDGRLAAAETTIASLSSLASAPILHDQIKLLEEDFASLPTTNALNSIGNTWSPNGGSWTASNGLSGPTGGWGTFFVWNGGASSIARRQFSTEITSPSAADIGGICTYPLENYGGGVAVIDRVAGKLRLYGWTGSGAGTLELETALPAGTGARRYRVTANKDNFVITVTCTDLVTGDSVSVSGTHSSTTLTSFPLFHGYMGLIKIAGAPEFERFKVIAPYKAQPLAVIVGDSIVDGSGLFAAGQLSWANQLAANRNDIITAGRSGDETPNFNLRKQLDLIGLAPKLGIIALGTNDTDQAAWRTNMAAVIASLVAAGVKPILVTQPPRNDTGGAQAIRTAMNNDIRAEYFGRYRWVDMAYALSNGHDGVTWNAAYDNGDHIHPNQAGHTVMKARALIDVPELAA